MASNSNSTPFENGLNYFGPQMPGPGHFDFSPLFEYSILSILPSALLLLVLPFRLRSLYKQSKKVTQSLLHTNKLVVLAIFTAFQAAVLILYAANSSVRTPTSLAAAVLVLVDALGLCLLSHAEHVHSLRPSTIINMYLLFTLLFDIAHTRTLWIEHAPRAIAAVFTVTVAVKFVIAVMEATEKRKILLAQYQDSNPEATSGIYSRAFFWWLNNLMTISFRRIIREEDLFPIEEEMSSKVLGMRAQKLWSKVDQDRSHALLWSTLNSTRHQLVLCVFPRLCLIGFRYTQPFLLSRTTDFVKSTTDSKNIGWGLTGAFGIVFIGMAIANALYFHMTFRFATALRGTLVSMICVKTMDLSITSLDESAAVTLMSNDTETICGGFQNVNEIWAVPLELGIAMWLLYRELGLSFLAPAAITIMSTWAVTMISGSMGKSQKIWNEGIQTRVDVTTNILGSMKAVKILGFTPKVAEILQGLRVKELKLSSFFRRLLCCTAFFSNSMRTLAGFVTFLVFVLIENYSKIELTAATAFTVLSLIGMLSTPVSTLLRTIPQLKSALACFDRIQKFLESPPRQPHVLPPNGSPNVDAIKSNTESGIKAVSSDIVADETIELDEVHPQSRQFSGPAIIDVQNASFSWTLDGPLIVNNVSFAILRNNFVFIIGPVGCGKSTLLKGLMGETPSSQGLVHSNAAGSAFVDQTPWVQNITIRKNIIGPSILDSAWYDEVIRACALDHDIAALPDSHDTIVGSRGISLSGGQKQRVALARALYAKKELMIIDDGFSGLDAETEESIFTKLFSNQGLLKQLGTTVIVVTNAVNRLSYADHIISLNATGCISEQGTLAQLGGSGGYVERLTTKHKYESESKSGAAEDSVESTSTESVKLAVVKKAKVEEDLNRPIGEWSTYRYYFASIGWTRSLVSLSYLVLSGTGTKLTELLLTYWTEAISERGNSVNPLYLGLYGMLAGVGTIFWSIATYHYFLYVVPSSAEELHARLLRSVMNAPLHFFTSTDTGITTNRFSQDMSVVDKELPFALIDLIVAAVQAFVGAILMCLVTGYFALTLPPVIFIVWVIQKFYLRTSRQVRLLDLEAKSPLYTHFIESLSGLATIRAFGWSEEFVQQNLVLLDNSQKPYYLLFCIQRWLSIVLDLMVTVLAVILMILVVELRDSVGAGYVGLAVLNVISFSASLSWIIRQWTSLETSIGAVSRLKKFTSTTPNENLPDGNQTVPDTWPEHGAITIKNLTASYTSDGSPVLTTINMEIKAGEKIGICGRTGSGKSSLISTLFRLLEFSPESSIIVDGIDITKIPRQVIRSRFNAIPQDTFFIPGTIRLNLSPETQQNTDTEIISALQKVELWTLVESKGGLDAKLETEFFSHGQRQLFSLARAILKKSKIVVLDEVSSSIDSETDRLVQAVVRREFEGATILSIAHRLNTIVDFEKVAVLGDGRLIEFDEPRVLLGREGSAFAELYRGI